MGTTKAVLSESSDDSNQALSMVILTSALGTGLILGPAVSGAISDPIGQYNLTITSRLWLIYVNSWYGICYADPAIHYFLTTFPYSLPCIVSMLLYIMSAIVVFIWLPETLGKKYKYYRWYCTDLIVSFLYRASKSHRSENSMSNSLVATEKKDGFNGEAVPQEDTELLIGCDEAEKNLLEEEEMEQEWNSRSWIKRHACCCITSLRKRVQKLRKGIVKSLKDLVYFMR